MASMHTIETAPRNEAELGKLGRYELRTIAQNLGLMATEEQKGAFMQLQNLDMAKQMLPALIQYDKAKKGGAAPAAAKPPQTPVTSETTAAKPNGHAAAPGGSGGTGAGQAQGGIGLPQLVEALTNLNVLVNKLSTDFVGRLDGIEATQEAHGAILRGTNRISLTGISLSLLLAEQVLNAPRADVIRDSHADVDSLVAALSALDPGIGEAAAEEEGEADAEGVEEQETGKE